MRGFSRAGVATAWAGMAIAIGSASNAATAEATGDPPAAPPTVAAGLARRLPGEYDGFEPVVAADGQGHVVVAAIDSGKNRILAWRSADGGRTFERPTVPLEGARRQFDPWLHRNGTGRFLLSFAGTRPSMPGVRAHLLRSEDGGRTWTPSSSFGPGPSHVDRPVFAVSSDGRRLAAVSFWSGPIDDPLRLLFSADGGTDWTRGPTPLATRDTGCSPTGVAIDNEGRAVVGYSTSTRRGTEATYQLGLALTGDGGRTWQQHVLGQLADDSVSPVAGIEPKHSQVGLAHDGTSAFHVLAAQMTEAPSSAKVRYWRSADGTRWSEPTELSAGRAELRAYPALAASGPRVHATWLECVDGWCHVRYRGSTDGGKTWSDRFTVSKPAQPTDVQTNEGFRHFSGHYFGIAEDGTGAAHIVWAVHDPHGQPSGRGEVWHAVVRLRP